VRDRPETDLVRAVVAGLARIVAADGGRLVLRSSDSQRRSLTVELSDAPDEDHPTCLVDPPLVADFLTEMFCLLGMPISELRVETPTMGEESR
jgi:hypothetical protein